MKLFSDERKLVAKEYLEKIQGIENKIRRKCTEKRIWFECATNTASNLSGNIRVQSSGNKEKMANTVVTGLWNDEKIDREIKNLKLERQEIVDVIESLPEPYCDILYRLYVEYTPLKEVAYIRKEHYHVTSTKHGMGLLKIYEVINNNK